jgi:hypothetical protein
MQQGLYAIQWPDPETAYNLLFSPARGLLFWTPFFVIAGFGYWYVCDKSPRLFLLTYTVPLLHIIVISGRTWDWQAGPTLGPRLLAPIVPLMALPCAFGVKHFPRLGLALALYSVAVTTLATLTDACPGYFANPNPLLDLHIPLLLKGEFSPNLGQLLGLPTCLSIAVYYTTLLTASLRLWRSLPPHAPYFPNPNRNPNPRSLP